MFSINVAPRLDLIQCVHMVRFLHFTRLHKWIRFSFSRIKWNLMRYPCKIVCISFKWRVILCDTIDLSKTTYIYSLECQKCRIYIGKHCIQLLLHCTLLIALEFQRMKSLSTAHCTYICTYVRTHTNQASTKQCFSRMPP